MASRARLARQPPRIITFPHPSLTAACKPVRAINKEVLHLVEQMLAVMHGAGGIGLAAPQIGRLLRLAVLHADGQDHVYINPKLSGFDGYTVSEEGCLSIPGVLVSLSRSERVHVKANGLDGKPFERDVQGMHAIILQHECDHLDGRLILPV